MNHNDTYDMCQKGVETIDDLLLECWNIHLDVGAHAGTLPEAFGNRVSNTNAKEPGIGFSKKANARVVAAKQDDGWWIFLYKEECPYIDPFIHACYNDLSF